MYQNNSLSKLDSLESGLNYSYQIDNNISRILSIISVIFLFIIIIMMSICFIFILQIYNFLKN